MRYDPKQRTFVRLLRIILAASTIVTPLHPFCSLPLSLLSFIYQRLFAYSEVTQQVFRWQEISQDLYEESGNFCSHQAYIIPQRKRFLQENSFCFDLQRDCVFNGPRGETLDGQFERVPNISCNLSKYGLRSFRPNSFSPPPPPVKACTLPLRVSGVTQRPSRFPGRGRSFRSHESMSVALGAIKLMAEWETRQRMKKAFDTGNARPFPGPRISRPSRADGASDEFPPSRIRETLPAARS